MKPRRGEEPLRHYEIRCARGTVTWVGRWDGSARHLGRLNGRPMTDERLERILDEVAYDRKMADIRAGRRPSGVRPNT